MHSDVLPSYILVAMSHKLSPEQQELYDRVDEVLHYLWDPIGISSDPHARDEYQSYVPVVFSHLLHHYPTQQIIDMLIRTESETMGLNITEASRKNAKTVVSIMEAYRDLIIAREPTALTTP